MNIIKPPMLYGELFQQSLGACTRQLTVFNKIFDDKIDVLHNRLTCNDALKYIAVVHDYRHVDSIVHGVALNGFGRNDRASTYFAVESCAAMLAAADVALSTRGPVFAPVSGFHHAGWNFAGGFCTFNGIMAAIEYVHPRAKRVLIIDGDGHWGDGTDDIITKIDRFNSVVHLSLCRSEAYKDRQNHSFRKLREVLSAKHYDLIIYQAGADSHCEDKLMAGYLTDQEWRWRDEVIFGYARDTKTPIVWNLAGGYNGKKTIDLYTDTFETARLVYEGVPRHLLSSQDLEPSLDLDRLQEVCG